MKDVRMLPMKNIIGERVKQARLNHQPRMTQAALATRLQLEGWDIPRSGIAKIELGLREVTDIEVARLAKVLGVSIGWLFGEESE